VADKTFIQPWSLVHSTVQKFLEFFESSQLTRNSARSQHRSAEDETKKLNQL
jgi:hypothetical protein